MSSIEPNDRGCEVDCGQEVSGSFVIAGCNGPELFELAEEVLDEMARLVSFLVVVALDFSVAFWRDNSLKVRAIKAVIPPKSTRKVKRPCDFALYAERNLVERFFNTIKHYRGIATRYEKTAQNFLAGLHLVCALTWLK